MDSETMNPIPREVHVEWACEICHLRVAYRIFYRAFMKTPNMKGCFLLQRQFAHIGHYLACLLKESYGLQEFCGYVYLRESYDFLKSQKDINYTTLLLDEDIHKRYENEKLDPDYLTLLEKEYGIPTLWPFLTVDRVLMSTQLVREYPYDTSRYTHEQMLRILQVHARAIIDMLDSERPDFLFCSVLGGVGGLLLYHIAKKRGIKIFVVLSTCVPNRWVLSDTYDTFSYVDRLFLHDATRIRNDRYWDKAGRFIQQFRREPTPFLPTDTPNIRPVTRKKQLRFLIPKNAAHIIISFLKNVRRHYERIDRFDYDNIGPWNYLKDATNRKIRNVLGNEDLYDPFDPSEPFAFFPLHYEPEVALLLQAPYFTDQIHLIKQIARSLPVQYKLVVKEHPIMAEYRPRSYYKKMKKIHNVKLVSPALSSFDIIPAAKLVTTITGSVGYEAALFRKPVISFGHWFYNTLNSVVRCSAIESLPYLIKDRLENFHPNDDELQIYIAALLEDAVELDLQHLWIYETDPKKKKEGLKPLATLLAKKLGLDGTG